MAQTQALTQEDRADYARDGFLAIDQVTTPAEVEALRAIYDRLFEEPGLVPDADRFELVGDPDQAPQLPQVTNPERYAPELLATQAFASAQEIARSLLGDEAVSAGMHAIRKPAGSSAETPWHQDEAYWDPAMDHHALSIWIPLQPVDQANGCMQFIPGSHRSGITAHELVNPNAHGLRLTEEPDQEAVVVCALPAGGATVHDSKTVHYTGPNRSAEPRRALIIAFSAPSTPLTTPRKAPWQRPEWRTA